MCTASEIQGMDVMCKCVACSQNSWSYLYTYSYSYSCSRSCFCSPCREVDVPLALALCSGHPVELTPSSFTLLRSFPDVIAPSSTSPSSLLLTFIPRSIRSNGPVQSP